MSSQVTSPTRSSDRATALAQLLELRPSLQASDWWQELREQAAARVQEMAIPSSRDEDWRFTDLSPLLQVEFQATSARTDSIEPPTLPEAAQSRLVFVNGTFAPQLSSVEDLPEGVSIANLSQSASQNLQPYLGRQQGADEVFTSLNTASFTDAAVVQIARNAIIETPIHLVFISHTSSTAIVQPRALVVAGANSSAAIVEEYLGFGEDVYFTNAVTEIWLEANARIDHTRIQRENSAAFHIGKTAVSQDRDSHYACHAVNLGGKLSRHNLEVYQTGAQTETVMDGLTIARRDQLADTHSILALTQPYGTSQQIHKCIVDDRAHAVFNGKVFVPKAAQKTNAEQVNRNLLLSTKARVDTKPQLEIVADDVRCTHGATVGQLEADEVFYLQSRGIDANTARKLLTTAFAYEIIDRIPIPSVRETLSQFL
ncbi:Fe-S cluster assembly protein SufD [Microcoleus sp. FACHB-1515]|uniref:Fe-S cluster assembly protein SufD n=1 Tax=Cyanophyceae TaxID=3028117 RepID=UPI001687BE87|nr:Fe-S cluster assembly protein SufD [Microcoleus sp. FACHB-1515]MBD2090451.1 Fe-S cluster assembly protein SufD [Microcoleus sp. FACHB-1515]